MVDRDGQKPDGHGDQEQHVVPLLCIVGVRSKHRNRRLNERETKNDNGCSTVVLHTRVQKKDKGT